MVKQVEDTADRRNKTWCIHCGSRLEQVIANRDHAPSKALLDEPFSANLPLTRVCQPCNSSFAEDEEYTAAFLGAVLSGGTNPDAQVVDRLKATFRGNVALRARIERSKTVERDLFGEQTVAWSPEHDRLRRVLIKNARGHAFYELGEPMLGAPSRVWFGPLAVLNETQTEVFENVVWPEGLMPEVGSRLMTRFFTGDDLDEGWIIVQEGVYRYAILQSGGVIVRLVMREYLAAEIIWE